SRASPASPNNGLEDCPAPTSRSSIRESVKVIRGLSEAKTLITHGRTQAARFLGYEVTVLHDDQQRDRRGRRSINGKVGLKVPADVTENVQLAKGLRFMVLHMAGRLVRGGGATNLRLE